MFESVSRDSLFISHLLSLLLFYHVEEQQSQIQQSYTAAMSLHSFMGDPRVASSITRGFLQVVSGIAQISGTHAHSVGAVGAQMNNGIVDDIF